MTLFKIVDQLFTGLTDISKDADICFQLADHKTVWITGVMFFLKSCDAQIPDGNGLPDGNGNVIPE